MKKLVSGPNDKLSSSDASFSKSKDKGKEKKKKIKYLGKSLDNLHVEVARLSVALNQATILEAKRDEEILRLKTTPSDLVEFKVNSYLWLPVLELSERLTEASPFLEPKKLVRLANVPILRDTRVSPLIVKESTVTPVSKSLELSANVAPVSSAVVSEQNEGQVSTAVDGSDLEMTDGAAHSKFGGVFVQGTSHVLDDVAEVTVVGSERVSSSLTDVVLALSAGEKGDGFSPSSTIEEVVVPPSRV
ncbi:hypothetical protein Tco_1412644 [Tanacetum coccineum]